MSPAPFRKCSAQTAGNNERRKQTRRCGAGPLVRGKTREIRDPAEEVPPAAASPLEQLLKELEEAGKSAQAYKDQFLRKAAEFENYKRRSDAEYLNLVRNANEGLISALLPIVEDLTRSLKAGSSQADGEAFYRGVELIYQKLMKVLEAQGWRRSIRPARRLTWSTTMPFSRWRVRTSHPERWSKKSPGGTSSMTRCCATPRS